MIILAHGLSLCHFTNYTFNGIACNFLMVVISMQLSICLQLLQDERIELSARRLLESLWASLSVSVSLYSVYGKTSPLQILIMTLSETTLFCVNDYFLTVKLRVCDSGYVIRTFLLGSFFGLGVALVIWRQKVATIHAPHSQRLRSSPTNLLCVLLSSILTFCIWPEFLASLVVGDKKHRIFVNSCLSMSCAVVTGFFTSSFADHQNRFSVVSNYG